MVWYSFFQPIDLHMKYLLKKYLIIVLSLYTLTQLVNAITITGGWKTFFYAGLLFSILTYIIKPLVNILLLPLNILTLNMISWVVNIVTFIIWTVLIPQVHIDNWIFPGLNIGVAVLTTARIDTIYVYVIGGIIFTLLFRFYNWVVG